MKKKVSALIDEEVIRRTKRRAVQEGRTLSDVIQDALVFYLSERLLDPKKREKAYQLFCWQPMRIKKEHFRQIIGDKAWEQ